MSLAATLPTPPGALSAPSAGVAAKPGGDVPEGFAALVGAAVATSDGPDPGAGSVAGSKTIPATDLLNPAAAAPQPAAETLALITAGAPPALTVSAPTASLVAAAPPASADLPPKAAVALATDDASTTPTETPDGGGPLIVPGLVEAPPTLATPNAAGESLAAADRPPADAAAPPAGRRAAPTKTPPTPHPVATATVAAAVVVPAEIVAASAAKPVSPGSPELVVASASDDTDFDAPPAKDAPPAAPPVAVPVAAIVAPVLATSSVEASKGPEARVAAVVAAPIAAAPPVASAGPVSTTALQEPLKPAPVLADPTVTAPPPPEPVAAAPVAVDAATVPASAAAAATLPPRTDARTPAKTGVSVSRSATVAPNPLRGPLAARAAFDVSLQTGTATGATAETTATAIDPAPAAEIADAPAAPASAAAEAPAAAPTGSSLQPGPVPLLAPATSAEPTPAPTPNAASAETVAGLAAEIVKKLGSKTTRFDLVLNPEGLGRVDVTLELGADGAATARLAFDRADTATQLAGRAGELQQALSQAGFDLPTGSIRFDAPAAATTASDPNGRSAWGGLGGGFSGGANAGGDGRGQDGSGRGAPGLRAFAAADAHTLPPIPATALRGLDIRI